MSQFIFEFDFYQQNHLPKPKSPADNVRASIWKNEWWNHLNYPMHHVPSVIGQDIEKQNMQDMEKYTTYTHKQGSSQYLKITEGAVGRMGEGVVKLHSHEGTTTWGVTPSLPRRCDKV